jgi:hypothetical protein
VPIPGFTSEAPAHGRQHSLVMLAAPAACPPGQTYDQCYADCAAACHEGDIRDFHTCLSACPAQCAACPHTQPPPPPTQLPPPPPVYPANTWTTMEPSTINCVATQNVIGGCDFRDPCPDWCDACGFGPSGCECLKTEVNCPTTRCDNWEGPCTGGHLWFWEPAPTRCINAGGSIQCCSGWNQKPWVKRCADGSAAAGCGFCI